LAVPSPGSVVIINANSRVPDGAFDQDNAMEVPAPSQVCSAGSVPPSEAAGLVSVKVPPAWDGGV
jgi:hypothetical protein